VNDEACAVVDMQGSRQDSDRRSITNKAASNVYASAARYRRTRLRKKAELKPEHSMD